MKRILIFAAVIGLIFCLVSCGEEKIEGDALEKYLEVVDALESGVVTITTDNSNSATVEFRTVDGRCEILAAAKVGASSYVNYFDGQFLYSGTDVLEKSSVDDIDPVTVKRALIGAPDYAFDKDFYDESKSGIYRTLTGYKVVVVSHGEEDDFKNSPDTVLTMYLDRNMKPTKTEVVDDLFDQSGKTLKLHTLITYKSLGKVPAFEVPKLAE